MQFLNVKRGCNTKIVGITMFIIIVVIIICHHLYAGYLQVYLKQAIFIWCITSQLFSGYALWYV